MIQYTSKQNQEYRLYLRKYSDTFQVKKHEDGIYVLRCYNKNFITIHSLPDKLLLYCLTSGKSSRAQKVLLKKLFNSGYWFEIAQRGDSEMNIIFKDEDLLHLSGVFKIIKRKKYSPEARRKLVERGKEIRAEELKKEVIK